MTTDEEILCKEMGLTVKPYFDKYDKVHVFTALKAMKLARADVLASKRKMKWHGNHKEWKRLHLALDKWCESGTGCKECLSGKMPFCNDCLLNLVEIIEAEKEKEIQRLKEKIKKNNEGIHPCRDCESKMVTEQKERAEKAEADSSEDLAKAIHLGRLLRAERANKRKLENALREISNVCPVIESTDNICCKTIAKKALQEVEK